MNQSFKTVLFDLDGTLLNSLEDLANSMNAVLQKLHFPIHSVDKYRYFVGDGIEKLARRTLPADKVEDSLVGSVVAGMRKEYGGRWHEATRPYDGIDELLNGLKAKGLILSILSNKPHEMTVKIVDYFFPQSPFEIVWGAKAAWPKKPSPEAALSIAEKINTAPEDMLFVGDTKIDMQTAKAAGMFAVGVTWGFRTRQELLESGAEFIADEPHQIFDFVD